MRLTSLEFASYLAYIPRSGGGQLGDQSRDLMHALKHGTHTGFPPRPFSWQVVNRIKQKGMAPLSFSGFLGAEKVLRLCENYPQEANDVPSQSVHVRCLRRPYERVRKLRDLRRCRRASHTVSYR